MGNIDLVFLFVIAAFIGYYFCKKENFDSVEEFTAIDDIRKAVRESYNADVDAIRNLSDIAKKLQAGGLSVPGTLTVNNLNVDGNINGKSMTGATITDIYNKITNSEKQLNENGKSLKQFENSVNQFGKILQTEFVDLRNESRNSQHHIGILRNEFNEFVKSQKQLNESFELKKLSVIVTFIGAPENKIYTLSQESVVLILWPSNLSKPLWDDRFNRIKNRLQSMKEDPEKSIITTPDFRNVKFTLTIPKGKLVKIWTWGGMIKKLNSGTHNFEPMGVHYMWIGNEDNNHHFQDHFNYASLNF